MASTVSTCSKEVNSGTERVGGWVGKQKVDTRSGKKWRQGVAKAKLHLRFAKGKSVARKNETSQKYTCPMESLLVWYVFSFLFSSTELRVQVGVWNVAHVDPAFCVFP